jgi:hypothetical protein
MVGLAVAYIGFVSDFTNFVYLIHNPMFTREEFRSAREFWLFVMREKLDCGLALALRKLTNNKAVEDYIT